MGNDVRLGELANIESGYAFKSSDWTTEGNPVVKIKNVKDGHVTLEDCAYVSDEIAAKASKFLARGGDILLSLTGYVGQVGRVDIGDAVLVNQRVGFVRPTDSDDKSFIYHLLRNLRTEIAELGTGTAQANVAPRDIMDLRVPNFKPSLRRKIGEVLDCFDTKIGLNAKISGTLENIAQTIFKSWFVDFDPVKAKMAGEKPVGMVDAVAALFPDSMEDSELGPVPSNWNTAPLTDLFDVLSGGTPKTTEESFWGGAIPWFSVVDAPESGGCFFIKTEKTITELGLNKSAAKIVRPGVTIISARGTVGKTAIVASPSTFNQSCYGLMGKYGDFYTYLLVKYMVTKLQNIAHGGMFDTITRDTFSALTVPKPMELIIYAFEKLVEPMFMQIRNLQYQSEQLATMRDALLPRLISGELQIPEEMLVS
jgi:restriction endonuclease S subunit